jgi:hypothetical protein
MEPRPQPLSRRALSWADVGTHLLSERTLHALLALGALLILASGVVISILNPTGLAPVLHLTAVLVTTLLFYAAGYFVRQRLHLSLTGAALLGIGGAFIPLCIWTLGQELLHWQPAAIWLLASTVSLPIYLASHVLLRDRTFAVLVAVAGGSQLLALANWLGVPLEWGLVLLIGLGCGYLFIARRLEAQWARLAWALAWTAQVSVPVVMLVLLGARFVPSAWQAGAGTPREPVNEYAVGAGWWLGAAFFGLASTLPGQRWFRVPAVWTVPVAYLLTLTRAPWEPGWHAVALALLAGGYLAYGHLCGADRGGTYRSLAGEPMYQVALSLTLLAAAWPAATGVSRVVALLTVAVVYGAAAELFHQRVWAYVAVSLLPVAYALLLDQLQVSPELLALAWTALAAVLLGCAEVQVSWTAENRRPLIDTVFGRGQWRSKFASPLFCGGYLTSMVAFWLAWVRYWNAPAQSGIRQLDTPTIVAFLVLVVIASLSSLMRRTSFFLFVATCLFLIPFNALAGRAYALLGLTMNEAELARLLAVLGVGYVLVARAADRLGGHYAKPLYLVGYFLSVATMLLSVLDRVINAQVVALSIAVYAVSAWWVDRGRHPAFLWTVEKVFGTGSVAARHMACLFLYLVCWLFPVWALLAMSLHWPSPETSIYGLALALLAPVYAVIGRRVREIRLEYRWPWYLAAYALSIVGPLVAITDPVVRLVTLTISVALYAASCVISRQSTWLYPVTLLTPVIVWQALDRLGVEPRLHGLALVTLALLYVASGVVLQHRTLAATRLLEPIRAPIDAFALPWFVVAFALSAGGLALVSSQGRGLVVLAFTLAGVMFAAVALVFRLSLFIYPMLGTLAVAYVVGMTLTDVSWQAYGIGLLPGMLVCLAVAEVFRRRVDSRLVAPKLTLVDRWATPFYAAAYLGTLAVPVWSTADWRMWAVGWWAVTLVYAVSVGLFSRPVWLYPALGAAVVAFLSTIHAAMPELATPGVLASMSGPAVVLFGIAAVITRQQPHKPTVEELGGSSRIWRPTWSDPLVLAGWLSLVIAVAGSAADPVAGLWAASIAAVVLAVVATLWSGRVEVWTTLTMAALAFWQAMLVLGVPTADQPPRWALAGLGLGLLAIILRRKAWRPAGMWPRPLLVVSVAAGGLSMLMALGTLVSMGRSEGLRTLSVTVALTGLTLVAHGFDRRDRIPGYIGVALLLTGYMLQLALFDVGQPQAFVLPAGLYLLAIAYLEWRRGTDHRFKAVLEATALILLLGVSLIQSVGFLCAGVDRYAYATFLLLESLAVFGLGAALHWRRSFIAGALVLVVDVFILLADPLRAMNTWYLIAVIGLAMIAAVILIEQRRQRIPYWLHEWRLRLETWE